MKKWLIVVALVVAGVASSLAQVDQQIIAREKAAMEAWQKKDKAFWMDYLTDNSTYFSAWSPYRDSNPKETFLPNFEKYTEMFKILDFSMYNPVVQVHGDVAVLSYNESVTSDFGGKVINYTGKVTSVYVKQGNTWRVIHGHESMNPGNQ